MTILPPLFTFLSVVPAINICLSNPPTNPYRGPQIVIITTTVDQATQAYKLFVRVSLSSPLALTANLLLLRSYFQSSRHRHTPWRPLLPLRRTHDRDLCDGQLD